MIVVLLIAIVILIIILLCFNLHQKEHFSQEALNNLNSVYNKDNMYINGINVKNDMNVFAENPVSMNDMIINEFKGPSLNTNIVNANSVEIDSKQLNMSQLGYKPEYHTEIPGDGCYGEPVKFVDPFTKQIRTDWQDKWVTTGITGKTTVEINERGFIKNASCKRGYYLVGMNQHAEYRDGITYRKYYLICCPFIGDK